MALSAAALLSAQSARVDVHIDTAEADAVLKIVTLRRSGQVPTASDWSALTSTSGYQRLKAREQSLQIPFDEGAFRQFVESEDLARRADDDRRTVDAWARADVTGAAARALAYLPADATIHATVFAVIKPRTNSFVFEAATNPAIFLYVDPDKSREQIENTMAHEMHHIGAASLDAKYDAALAALPPAAQAVGRWMGGFAEGIAMLAAAGGPDVHPHAMSPAADRERWDRDVANFDTDLRHVEQFFVDVLDGRLTGDAIQQTGMTFFGVQGPWYTVGWKMAVVVERAFGREEVRRGVADPRQLLASYNRAVREQRLNLPLWSDRVMSSVRSSSTREDRLARPVLSSTRGSRGSVGRSRRTRPSPCAAPRPCSSGS